MVMDKYGLNKDDTYEKYNLAELEDEKNKLIKLLKEAQEKERKNDRKVNPKK